MDTLPTTVSLRRWWQRFLDELPDFHARLFITAAVTGFVSALVGAVANYLNDGEPALVTLTLGLAAASLAMIWFAKRTGRYELARVATVIIVFSSSSLTCSSSGVATTPACPPCSCSAWASPRSRSSDRPMQILAHSAPHLPAGSVVTRGSLEVPDHGW